MMNKLLLRSAISAIILLIVSCSSRHFLDKLEQIKSVGDQDPNKALVMLDSLEISIRNESDYVRHKYDLLRIRLNDKAYKMPTSDIMIKQLVEYFESEGSIQEKQEANYYAGSTYRDLQDTPRALEHFFKSLDFAEGSGECDSILLRNTYSNIHYLQYRVQDYNNAVAMAQKELEISKKIKSDLILPYMHLGASNLALKNSEQAENALDSAFSHTLKLKDTSSQQSVFIYLLNNYSELKSLSKAKKCMSLINSNPKEDFASFPCLAFAQYYRSLGMNDSTIVYCKLILDESTNDDDKFDASKILYRIYSQTGDISNACKYAETYMQLSDSLDFGKRQELAATVNNEYQYHLDQKKERELYEEKKKFKNALIIVSFITLFSASIAYIFAVRRRNKHLQMIVALSSELQRVSDDDKQLREDIKAKEKELDNSTSELNSIKGELQRVNDELLEFDKTLKEKEQQLADKIEQNKAVMNMMHQSELEDNAEDVIYNIRQSSIGRKDMTTADWKKLYQAVDQLYPKFKDRLLKELGSFTDQQMQVCYLMRIGLSKPQIQNITNLSRVTVWRWVKKYEWVLETDDKL